MSAFLCLKNGNYLKKKAINEINTVFYHHLTYVLAIGFTMSVIKFTRECLCASSTLQKKRM